MANLETRQEACLGHPPLLSNSLQPKSNIYNAWDSQASMIQQQQPFSKPPMRRSSLFTIESILQPSPPSYQALPTPDSIIRRASYSQPEQAIDAMVKARAYSISGDMTITWRKDVARATDGNVSMGYRPERLYTYHSSDDIPLQSMMSPPIKTENQVAYHFSDTAITRPVVSASAEEIMPGNGWYDGPTLDKSSYGWLPAGRVHSDEKNTVNSNINYIGAYADVPDAGKKKERKEGDTLSNTGGISPFGIMDVQKCSNCAVTSSAMWRRLEGKKLLCNACGLYYRTHGRHRPDALFARRRQTAGNVVKRRTKLSNKPIAAKEVAPNTSKSSPSSNDDKSGKSSNEDFKNIEEETAQVQ